MKLRTPLPVAAPPSERSEWQGYGFAALMLLAALAARWALDPVVGESVPLVTMYIATAFAVWYGGWKPAVALMTLGYFAALWCFLPPRFEFKLWEPLGLPRAVLYWPACLVTVLLCESLRRSQRRHAASEAKVVSILDHMREGFLSVDAEWRITSVNLNLAQSVGQSRERLLGRPLWTALPELHGKPIETQLRQARSEAAARQFESNALNAGVWHLVTATPIDGGLLVFFHENTAQKAHVEQLERLVDDRTAALQRLVAELESFSYTLVHDIRGPLRAITGFADILAVDHAAHLDPEGRRHVGRIQQSARRMDQLIVDILTYSRLSRGKPDVHSVDLDELLRDIVRSLPECHPEKAEIEIESPLPRVQGNEALLIQCFSNLLHNAAKFVAPGIKPHIRIAAQASGTRTRIEVSDNGIGIAPEARARIFEPFHREHPTYEGTGIGLAIVRKVVDQLGGRVDVESQPGHGSRFWVELIPGSPAPIATPHRVEARVLV